MVYIVGFNVPLDI